MDLELLKKAGINTDRALERFMGNGNLYAKMLRTFLDDRTFENLVEAVSKNNGQVALSASHTLKGICGNLSLEKLFNLFSEQVVLMRADQWNKAYAMMAEITENYKKTTEAIQAWLDKGEMVQLAEG